MTVAVAKTSKNPKEPIEQQEIDALRKVRSLSSTSVASIMTKIQPDSGVLRELESQSGTEDREGG